MKETMKYEVAVQELETIVHEIEQGTLELDAIVSKLKRAKYLLSLCRQRLTDADVAIREVIEGE